MSKVDYSKGMIYKLVCNDTGVKELYIGSTTCWKARKNQHKSICSNSNASRHHLKVYKTIRDNGGWDNWTMVLIEEYPCDSKLKLHARERYWIEELKAQLNRYIPAQTSQESSKRYYENNRELVSHRRKQHYEANKENMKQYREDNKERRKQQNKSYREANKDKIKEYKKEYQQKNKEAIGKKWKLYYEANKDVLFQKRKEKITCQCGSTMRKDKMKRHLESDKHIQFLIRKWQSKN